MIVPNILSTTFKKKSLKSTKPSTKSVKDMYEEFIAFKVESSLIYFIKKKVLYKDTEKEIEILKKKLLVCQYRIKDIQERKEMSSKLVEKELDNKKYRLNINIRSYEKALVGLEYGLDSGVTKVIDYSDFKKILSTHNEIMGKMLIAGHSYNLGNSLGRLQIRVIERNHNNKKVDFNATRLRKKQLLEEGVKEEDLYHSEKNPKGTIKYTVYHTDDNYLRVMWDKYPLSNISIYQFEPANDPSGKPGKGYKGKVKAAFKNNPSLKNNYPFVPLKIK